MSAATAAPAAPWDRSGLLGSTLGELDDSFDAAFASLRGRRWPDTSAAVLSNLSDYGFVWAVTAALKARRPGARWRMVTRLWAAGVASFALNKVLKACFTRRRPEPAPTGNGRAPLVRSPSSSSFPSGHTLASFCTAAVLADGPTQAVAFSGLAAAVAASRVHLRAHHATDVLAGAVAGTALGLLTRRFLAGEGRFRA